MRTLEELAYLVQQKSKDQILVSGASDEEISKIEKKMELEFPNNLREMYKRSNGQKEGTVTVFKDNQWVSLDRLLDMWNELKGAAADEELNSQMTSKGPVKPMFFNQKWIPAFWWDNGCIVIDMDPDEGGTPGQIVDVWYENDERKVLAKSVTDFIDSIKSNIVTGIVQFDKEMHSFCSPEESQQIKEELAVGQTRAEAFKNSPHLNELKKLSPGTEVEIVGMVDWSSDSKNHELKTNGGIIAVRGWLGDPDQDEDKLLYKIFKIKLKVGKKSLMGLGSPKYEVLSYKKI